MESPPIIILILLTVTLVILVTGVVIMAIGGELSKKYSNALMTARVVSQASLVLLLGLLYLMT